MGEHEPVCEQGNPEDKLSRSEYKKLSEEDKGKYKLNPRQDTYTIFNIDQTTMSHVHKEDYGKYVCEMDSMKPNSP